jgi:hypothetical protein
VFAVARVEGDPSGDVQVFVAEDAAPTQQQQATGAPPDAIWLRLAMVSAYLSGAPVPTKRRHE